MKNPVKSPPGTFRDHGGTALDFDRILSENWSHIARVAERIGGDAVLPVENPIEMGCGHYGCVFETPTQNIIMKVTFDPTEADFTQWIMRKYRSGYPFDGLAKFHGVCSLPRKYKGMRPYVIWRERLGIMGLQASLSHLGIYPDEYVFKAVNRAWGDMLSLERAAMSSGSAALRLAWEMAISNHAGALERLEHADKSTVRAVAYVVQSIGGVAEACEALSKAHPSTRLLGESLSALIVEGAFVVDIHVENLGLPFGVDNIVLADPGRVLFVQQPDAVGRC